MPKPATQDEANRRADEARQAGTRYLTEVRAFSATLSGFVAGGTRRGLDVEVETIRTTIADVNKALSGFRALSSVTIQKPPAAKVARSRLEHDFRAIVGQQAARRIPNKLVAEGVRRMIQGESFSTVVRDTLEQSKRTALARADAEVRRVTGLGLRDFRDMRRAIRLRANREIDRVFDRILVNATGNALVIEIGRRFVIPWLKAELTKLLKPKRSLDQRVAISIASLREVTVALNALPPDARLRDVHATWQRANAALAATRFLVADIKRAKREGLLAGDYGTALSEAERAMGLAQIRFLLHKEDLVKTLAVDQAELKGLIADLQKLVNGVRPQQLAPAVASKDLVGTWNLLFAGVTYDCEVFLTAKKSTNGFEMSGCETVFRQWRVEGGQLLFIASDGVVTIRMSRVGARRWEGQYLGHPTRPIAPGTVLVYAIERK